MSPLGNSPVPSARQVATGTGLTGGGDLSGDRTLALDVNSLTEDLAPDEAADFLVAYDTSAAGHRKVKPATLARLKDHQYNALRTVLTTTASIPNDNTIPQSTEGTELTALATTITPKNAANRLLFFIGIHLSHSVASTAVAALFQDSAVNALAAKSVQSKQSSGNQISELNFEHEMAAGTTSPTTFKVRVGTSAGTLTINGSGGGQSFGGGGVAVTSLRVLEIKP